jgi:hypothetical protein
MVLDSASESSVEVLLFESPHPVDMPVCACKHVRRWVTHTASARTPR